MELVVFPNSTFPLGRLPMESVVFPNSTFPLGYLPMESVAALLPMLVYPLLDFVSTSEA